MMLMIVVTMHMVARMLMTPVAMTMNDIQMLRTININKNVHFEN